MRIFILQNFHRTLLAFWFSRRSNSSFLRNYGLDVFHQKIKRNFFTCTALLKTFIFFKGLWSRLQLVWRFYDVLLCLILTEIITFFFPRKDRRFLFQCGMSRAIKLKQAIHSVVCIWRLIVRGCPIFVNFGTILPWKLSFTAATKQIFFLKVSGNNFSNRRGILDEKCPLFTCLPWSFSTLEMPNNCFKISLSFFFFSILVSRLPLTRSFVSNSQPKTLWF